MNKLMASLQLPWEFDKLQNKDPYSALVHLVEVLSIEPNDPYIQELLNQASGFGNSREATMVGFMNYWEDKKNSLSVKAGVNPKSIQLMTIHRSKGLQFPVVILPLISWKGSKKGKDKEWVELGGDPLTIGLVNVTQALENTSMKEAYIKEKAKSDLDKLNLLYVALTRAEDRMYIQVSDPGIKGLGKSLSEYVNEHGGDGKLEFGAEIIKDAYEDVNAETSTLKAYEKNKRDDLLSVALSKEDKNRRQRDFGESVHKLLETVRTEAEMDEAMRTVMPKEVYSEEERQKAESACKAARKLESQLNIDKNKFIETMEIALMDEKGRAYRIDKLFLDEKEKQAVVIDYKTGEKRDSDLKQINSYKEILEEMGYGNVKAYLIYTETDELIPA
jgi:ATP-dependent exoDNAse (exonuclease V) beta subunit